jgi:3-isopropylmalate/(R)-2-methylmalate dehydratase large subunit
MNDKVPAGKYSVNFNRISKEGPGSRTLLASPFMAAAAAVTGVLTDQGFDSLLIRNADAL